MLGALKRRAPGLRLVPVAMMVPPVPVSVMPMRTIGVGAVAVPCHARRLGAARRLAEAIGIGRRIRTIIRHALRVRNRAGRDQNC